MERQLVDNNKESNASPSIPSPFLSISSTESSEETGEDHDQVGHNGNEDVCPRQTGDKSQVEKQERGGKRPVYVSCPIDFTINGCVCVWQVVPVGFGEDDLVVGDAVTSCHGKVGEEGKGGDEGSQDVEETFLLRVVSFLLRLTGSSCLRQGPGKPCHRRQARTSP